MKRFALIICAFMLIATLCSCKDNTIPPEPVFTADTTVSEPPIVQTLPPEISHIDIIFAEFVGSYLTMRTDERLPEEMEGPYFEVFTDFEKLSDYYDKSGTYYYFGKKFTLECASFGGSYTDYRDVLILKLNEPSSYYSHVSAYIAYDENKATLYVEKHISNNSQGSDSTYHLVFTAPKGSFDCVKGLPLSVVSKEIIDPQANVVNDSEQLYIYPEFWPFVYRADALNAPQTFIDTIQSYDELVAFYEKYNDSYEIQDDFKKHIGSLYDEALFEDYVLLTVLAPWDESKTMLEIDNLFVYNNEIYIVINNSSQTVISKKTPCCLLVTAVSKSGLEDVNLSMFNISFN